MAGLNGQELSLIDRFHMVGGGISKRTPAERLFGSQTLEEATRIHGGIPNKTLGVGLRRSSYVETHDDFPTPPWVARALMKYVIPDKAIRWSGVRVLEQACGRGHISGVMREY